MTIRIIKQGKHPNLDVMTGTCSCGTEIECERGDTTNIGDTANGWHREVQCPACKAWIEVEEKESNAN